MKEVPSVLNRKIVLNVNKNGEALGIKTVKKALCDITGSSIFGENEPPAKPVLIEYELDSNGQYDFEKVADFRDVTWDEWVKLPIRGHDMVIHTARAQIRVPTVIKSINMDRMPKIRKSKPTNDDILSRDNYTCQYSGKKYPRELLNVDHVISKDEWRRRGLPGSPNTWENMVASYKFINQEKGNKTLSQAGLKLIRQPKAPLPTALCQLIHYARHMDWKWFLHQYKGIDVNIGQTEYEERY